MQRRRSVARGVALATAGMLVLAGCSARGGSGDGPSASSSAKPAAKEAPVPTSLPTKAEWARAEKIVASMSLREKAGQILIPAWSSGPAPVDEIRRLHLGGLIAMPSGQAHPYTLRKLNREVRALFKSRKYPAFLSVDQEGGLVNRVGRPVTTLPAFMAAGAADDTALTRAAARASAAELRGIGFTVVFAPDADVTIGSADPAIGSRAAGDDPLDVARHVFAARAGIEDAGLIPVLKHFPGHGSVDADSHFQLPVQRRSLSELKERDLVPFTEAIRTGAPAIMTAHIRVLALDRKEPVTASRKVTHDFLRGELGYRGLVVTDALNMRGIQDLHPGSGAAVAALAAGADVLLMPTNARKARDRILKAIRNHRISRARLDQANTRMIAALLHADATAHPRPLGSGRLAARKLARAALTSVAGPCSGRLVGRRIRLGNGPAAARLGRLLVRHRISIVPSPGPAPAMPARPVKPTEPDFKRPKKQAAAMAEYRAALREYRSARKGYRGAKDRYGAAWSAYQARLGAWRRVPLVAVDGYGSTGTSGDIVVAMDRPQVLGRVRGRVKLAAFGGTGASYGAVVDVLLGKTKAPGRLPVKVRGVDRRGCGS